jgi:hypothetical protein
MLNLYTPNQAEFIKNNIVTIMNNAKKKELELVEPTIFEFKKVHEIIKNYIIKKKKIIYGGYALDELVTLKNKKDAIYNPELDLPDIEFYSTSPVNDLIEICDLLYSKNYQYVSGKNAQHAETYSIVVNFRIYCDITYVPENIYKHIPYIEKNSMRLVDPMFIYIDTYRVFTDPLTSYWRLEKTFDRAYLLQKYYPIKNTAGKIKINNDNNVSDIIKMILTEYIHKNKMILVNYYAYNYFIEQVNRNDYMINMPYLDAITDNYDNDIIEIVKILKKFYNNDITVEKYYPFFQFTGSKTIIKYKNKIVINIFDNNQKCLPYIIDSKGYYVGTFSLTLLMLLILNIKTRVDNDELNNKNCNIMMSNLLIMRNYYLKKHKKTLLDKTPFEEFKIECIGTTDSFVRKYRLEIENKKKQKKKFTFNYYPEKDKDKIDISNETFENTSGTIIKTSKNNRII